MAVCSTAHHEASILQRMDNGADWLSASDLLTDFYPLSRRQSGFQPYFQFSEN
jgi:hypothetical protein